MDKEKGFTLLEVMITLSILGLVLATMVPVFIGHSQHQSLSEIRTGAALAAKEKLDDLRFLEFASIPTSGSSTPESISVGGKDYQVVATYCSNSTYCASSETRHITVSASYSGVKVYEIQTIYSSLF